MTVTGIICEYNPFHLGHKKQIDEIRRRLGEDCAIVCLMSGNYVQRGMPALLDKSFRAKAAILSGADLVLELPITVCLSSAEGFSAGGVKILSPFCDFLCFGSETADADALLHTARTLLRPDFSPALRKELDKGVSFPAARQAALQSLGCNADILRLPNDILGVEYCKAILQQGAKTQPLVIHRCGSYHAQSPDAQEPSATALRGMMCQQENWRPFTTPEAAAVFTGQPLHTLSAGERAMLTTLRTMTDDQFAALPYGSEGLWRKFMHACREQNTLEEIITATKSKRYTRTRLDRMAMCAFLGITAEQLAQPAPYTRILAFNDTGRAVLRAAQKTGCFINAGTSHESSYYALECRAEDLYGLFCSSGIEPPGAQARQRIFYKEGHAQ